MALGFSAATAAAILNAAFRGTSYAGNANVWVQLHTADPGVAGTTAVAGNDTRRQATFGNAATTGSIANTAAITWTTSEVDTSEDYSHASLWTASTAGTFIGSGLVTASAVTSGNEFTIAIGGIVVTLPTAA